MKIYQLIIFFMFPIMVWAKTEGTINGFVRDIINGEPLPYVNVFLQNTQLGATTNEKGYYVINRIPPGEYQLIFSMMGYSRHDVAIIVNANAAVKMNASLQPSVLELEGVVKTAERERFEREVEISSTTLSARQMRSLPSFAETDLFRTLQLLPGVVSRSDFSSQLYVRGGSPDQNLVLLDGVTVYNPFHLLSLFSMFNTDAIKEVEFITGGFPAEFGGRLSSVLNIVNNEGNSKEFHGKVNISLPSAHATLEGPIPHGSYLVSARRTYFDQVFKNTRYDFPYYFYDLQGKVNIDLGGNHRLTLSGYYGNDKLDYDVTSEEDDFQVAIDWLWGNRTASLNWRWLIHPNLFSEVLLTRSNFTLDLDLQLVGDNIAALKLNNGILDYSIKSDLNYFGLPGHSIKFGASQTWYDFLYSFYIDQTPLFNYNNKPALFAFYLQDQWQMNDLWSVRAGVRMENYDLGRRTRVSPRLGAKYHLFSNFALKGSFGIYHQFLTTAASDNQNFSFIDLWFPLAQQYKPLSATHYVAGFEWWLPGDLILTCEGYYKNLANMLELNENGEAEDESDDFFVGDGSAVGVEVLLKRSLGRATGWLGYSFAVTRRMTEGIEYYPKHDRRHNLNLALNYDLGKEWLFGLVYVYGSGMPYTSVVGKYTHYDWSFTDNEFYDTIYNRLGEKNSSRYPTYHRMDISIRKNFHVRQIEINPFFQVMNVYNHKNVFLYFWDHDSNPSKAVTINMFPFLPSLGVEIAF